jgi:hypothetical protein
MCTRVQQALTDPPLAISYKHDETQCMISSDDLVDPDFNQYLTSLGLLHTPPSKHKATGK